MKDFTYFLQLVNGVLKIIFRIQGVLEKFSLMHKMDLFLSVRLTKVYKRP